MGNYFFPTVLQFKIMGNWYFPLVLFDSKHSNIRQKYHFWKTKMPHNFGQIPAIVVTKAPRRNAKARPSFSAFYSHYCICCFQRPVGLTIFRKKNQTTNFMTKLIFGQFLDKLWNSGHSGYEGSSKERQSSNDLFRPSIHTVVFAALPKAVQRPVSK